MRWLANSDCQALRWPCVKVAPCEKGIAMKNSPWMLLVVGWRLARLVVHISGAFVCASVYPALPLPAQRGFLQWWSCGLLNLLNVRHQHAGQPALASGAAALLVANHISWLDIFAINVITPARFVAKSEVSDWPVVGWLVQRSGTLFIRRTVRSDTVRVNSQVASLLGQGRAVALFPQGTSAHPEQGVHFHAPMLQSAISAGAQVQPIAVFYHDPSGGCHAAAAFVDDMSFMQSLWKIVRTPDLQVTVTYLPTIDAAGQDRREVAALAQRAVNEALTRHLTLPQAF